MNSQITPGHDAEFSGEPVIKVNDLVLDIGQKRILDGVSFAAEAGKVTGLIGPNGAGKSSLLAAICGDVELTSGTIRICGYDPENSKPAELARQRAVMLQDVSVSFEFLVRDVVAMGRRPWKDSERSIDDEKIIDAALDATETHHLAGRDIVTLSGGERARVALARVLAQDTVVIMLDEPTAALDIKHQERVLGLVRVLAQVAGKAVLMVLHDLNAAAAYCDHIVCLANGSVAAQGSVQQVYTSETLSEVYGWPISVSTSDGLVTVHPARQQVREGSAALISLLDR